MHSSLRLIVQTLVFSRSYLHRQVSPPETLVVKGGNTWERNGRQFWRKAATSTHTLSGSFTCRKYATWDKQIYFTSEGRRAEDFFALKNPTASLGFEHTNLDTKGQHDTSRPPKPRGLFLKPDGTTTDEKVVPWRYLFVNVESKHKVLPPTYTPWPRSGIYAVWLQSIGSAIKGRSGFKLRLFLPHPGEEPQGLAQ